MPKRGRKAEGEEGEEGEGGRKEGSEEGGPTSNGRFDVPTHSKAPIPRMTARQSLIPPGVDIRFSRPLGFLFLAAAGLLLACCCSARYCLGQGVYCTLHTYSAVQKT